MLKHFLPVATAACVVCGCQRIEVHPSVYDPQGIRDVKTWYVGFTYFAGAETETASKAGEVEQTTIQREAPRKDDLQLRDDIEFRLRDRFGIRTTRDREKADGTINLHATYYVFAGHKSLDVLISDKAATVLARLKIVNGQTAAVIDDYERFAWRCADEIGKALRQ
jgi:hypothetical protein